MTNLETRFETTGPINLKVEQLVGDVTLTATDDPTTTVRLKPHGRTGEELARRFTVEARGNDVVVLAPKKESFIGLPFNASVDVEIDLPASSTVDVRTASGDIQGSGLLADVHAATGAGDIALHELAAADLKSGSGDIAVQVARNGIRAKTGSGDVVVGQSGGRVDLVSGSGDVHVRRADAEVKAKTGSGDVVVKASVADLDLMTGTGDVVLGGIHGGAVKVRTGTGDVSMGVAAGVAAYLDLNTVTGDVDVDLDETDGPGDAEAQTSLAVQSGSGDIHVKRAQVSLS
ncbi:DUF4097 family beta strand repeat-containing protein [Intrasporangium sp. DVR]|uniref:DUF4097 family beta strand repeat-containing protein n=1 Tax=Intrasporangium sp. DVR TaxID=3127867 RepID=UPI00313A7194